MNKTRYAICGLSTRGIYQFVLPLIGKNLEGGPNFSDTSEIVAILDLDPERVAAFLERSGIRARYYHCSQLKKMLRETAPEVLIVTGPDSTHCAHIVAGLTAGCDVIVEKPMVINSREVQRVRKAEIQSGRRVRVAHNYRYTPAHRELKRRILAGELGRIVNVEFTYNLDTWHGSSYFYRWNRIREASGGLSVHKCCHHFDLVNWWIGDVPEEVFAYGALNFFGPEGALRPRDANGGALSPEEEKRQCPIFQAHYEDKAHPSECVMNTGWDHAFALPHHAQYPPDQWRYIYDEEIRIEDTYSVVARYRHGASLSYSCSFCTPWEGYTLGINGTLARAEIQHRTDHSSTGTTTADAHRARITILPLFGEPKVIDLPPVPGGHGGADFAIQRDLFGDTSRESTELQLIAGSEAGAQAIAMGEAVWRSIQTRRPVAVTRLLHPPE